ncbi:hypothetical protein AZZ95_002188, partial [Enterobacter roggenkampii]
MRQGKGILVPGKGDDGLMLPAIAFIMHFRQADSDSGKTDLSDERFDLSREQPYLFITDPEVQALIPDQANFFGGGDKLCCIATFEGGKREVADLEFGGGQGSNRLR